MGGRERHAEKKRGEQCGSIACGRVSSTLPYHVVYVGWLVFGRRVVVGWGQNRNAWLAVFQRQGAPECIGLVGGSVGRWGRPLGGLVGR